MSLSNNLDRNKCCENFSDLHPNLTFHNGFSLNSSWTYEEILFFVIESIVAIFAMLGNILVIIVFIRERRLRRKTNYYIISLASADFCVGLLGIPFALYWLYTGSHPHHKFVCLVPISFVLTLCNISVFSLLLISIDRILSINLPLNGTPTSKNVAKEIGLCWIVGLLVGFMPVFWHKEPVDETCSIHDVMADGYLIFRFTFVILIPAIVIIFIYVNIYKIIIRQIKNEALLKRPPTSYGAPAQKRPEDFLRREIRATINISLIVFMFIILWTPLHIVYLLPIFCETCHFSRNTTALAISVAHSNSAINPLLYAYHMTDIRKAILQLLRVESKTSLSST